ARDQDGPVLQEQWTNAGVKTIHAAAGAESPGRRIQQFDVVAPTADQYSAVLQKRESTSAVAFSKKRSEFNEGAGRGAVQFRATRAHVVGRGAVVRVSNDEHCPVLKRH